MRVLMFPWLAHGHTAPFIELAKKLSQKDFHIYVYSTPENLNSVKRNLSEEHTKSIEFVDFQLPSLPELPSHYQSTKSLPHNLKLTLVKALDMTQDDFTNTLKTLKPDFVIYDCLQPWVPQLASEQNIPAIGFMITGAAVNAYAFHSRKKRGEPFPYNKIYFPMNMIKRVYSHDAELLTDVDFSSRPLHFVENSYKIVLVNSSRELEGKYIDYISDLMNKKVIPVGPLVRGLKYEDDNKEIMEWLDKKEKKSVVYIAFGSEATLTKEELQKIAIGLELSKLNFLWALKFSPGEKLTIEEALPEGFLDRVGERGLLVQDWVPQGRILAHPSTGGFLSHCGWNASLESLEYGVPVMGLPLHYEQPVNAKLLVEIGVAKEITRDDDANFEAEELAKVIREVVVEESGEIIRKRARELSDIIKNKLEEPIDDALVDELVQICKKNE